MSTTLEGTSVPKAVKSVARRAIAKQTAYRRVARAGGWGLLVGALAGIVAACIPTLLAPWQLVSIGTSFGMALDYLGLMPSSYRRKLLTKWAKHYDELVRAGLISELQRQQQVDILLSKYGP
jgi:hypothetical protein